jgi:hypothetical protein
MIPPFEMLATRQLLHITDSEARSRVCYTMAPKRLSAVRHYRLTYPLLFSNGQERLRVLRISVRGACPCRLRDR